MLHSVSYHSSISFCIPGGLLGHVILLGGVDTVEDRVVDRVEDRADDRIEDRVVNTVEDRVEPVVSNDKQVILMKMQTY